MPIAKRIAVDSARKPVILFSSSAYDQNVRWRATLPDKTEAVGPFSAFYSLGANKPYPYCRTGSNGPAANLAAGGGHRRCLRRERQHRAKARLCLLRG